MGQTILDQATAERRVQTVVPVGTKVKAFELGPCSAGGFAVSLHSPEVIKVGFLDHLRQHFPSGSTCAVEAVGEDGIRFDAESWDTIVAVLEAANASA